MTAAIRIENVSKHYRIGAKQKGYRTLRESLTEVVAAPFRRIHGTARRAFNIDYQGDTGDGRNGATLWALKDISFDVQPGEVVGVIGRNGAGKSTLLKILSRITEPSSGRITINGRVGSLLEVGTGFHPELTGRENIYMNGAILGMTRREIDRKFDEIVEFSGVEQFLDTPIKRYSSGMQVRLAFAVAANLQPEILIIDEVLAVGDAEFQRKCLGKMQDVAISGRTVLFVSHNMAAVESLCSRGIVLAHGGLEADSHATASIQVYMQSHSEAIGACDLRAVPRPSTLRPVLTHVEFLNDQGVSVSAIPAGESVTIRISYADASEIRSPRFGIIFETEMGHRLFFLQTDVQSGQLPDLPSCGVICCRVPSLPLLPGRYFVTLGCSTRRNQLDFVERASSLNVESADVFGTGVLPPKSHGSVLVNADWHHG